ncbi:MAG TPA: TonB family protein [Terriglobia bacterium]|nr:TonB family protein [Terriglobia bacterium]
MESKNLWTAKVVLYDPVIQKPAPTPAILPPPKVETPKPVEAAQPPKIVEPKPVAPPLVARARIPAPQPPRLQPAVPPTETPQPALPKWQPKVRLGAFSGNAPAAAKLKVPDKVQTGAFNGTAPAEAKLNLPVSKVQTGGFGSPNGLPGHAEGGSHGNVAHLGAFDRPAGPGSGNGSGGTRGARGLVASAGFGSVGEGAPSQGAGSQASVQSAGFADAQAMTQSATPAQPRSTAPAYDPVEITSKPDPVYTAEARKLHIQGEVLLRVLFTASGRLEILGVSRGLGHGLDQAAIQAAQQIQFKPARRNGQPVDTSATLHIVFQLAE